MLVGQIPTRTAKEFIRKHHYAVISPPINKICIGWYEPVGYDKDKLVGVAMWGYGVRPKHTIKRMFPSLDVGDYLELNRLCLLDEMPRNSETRFIKANIQHIMEYFPEVKVLFSWADGMRGKPGYIYQASNFKYGGKIVSEFYITSTGEVVHPRFLITRFGRRDKKFTESIGLTKIRGFQFRYCKFLCSHKERKRLLDESPYTWNQDYPKRHDLRWKIIAEEGSRESRQPPRLKGPGQFRHSASKLGGVTHEAG